MYSAGDDQPVEARGPARRDRARGREGHAHALGARQGAARAAGPSPGLLPRRARARARRRSRSSPCSATSARRSRRRCSARLGAGAMTVVEQTEQRGTGHAVRLAMPALARMADGLVLVLYGDVPLLRRETLEELVGDGAPLRLPRAGHRHAAGSDRLRPHPARRARPRDRRRRAEGRHRPKSAPSPRSTRASTAGPPISSARRLPGLGTGNAQGEYYLTDVVARAAAQHRRLRDRGRLPRRRRASTIASSSPRPRRRCAGASTAR